MTPYYETDNGKLYNGDVLEVLKSMESGIVQCVVTSPPYWGLRDYGIEGQLGLEETPEEYIDKMVEIFREVKRVMRDDGTLWLNMGDSYWNNFGGGSGTMTTGNAEAVKQRGRSNKPPHEYYKIKDLCGIPWRLAMALQEPIYQCHYCGREKRYSQWAKWDNGFFQICGCGARQKIQPIKIADGWYLRSDIIWSKPNPMPESCTDRPTKAHEYVFLMSKQAKYFYDADAVREAQTDEWLNRTKRDVDRPPPRLGGEERKSEILSKQYKSHPVGRNRRTVWTISTQPYSEAHFATFPVALVIPCIKAGTSEKGNCSVCGKPWVRVVEKDKSWSRREQRIEETYYSHRKQFDKTQGGGGTSFVGHKGYFKANGEPIVKPTKTIGWQPSCTCNADTVKPIVLDPFMGSGTVAEVCERYGRAWIGIELSQEYCDIARKRINKEAAQMKLEIS